MSICTWEGCQRSASYPMLSADQGDVWADLCEEHQGKFNALVKSEGRTRSPLLLQAWVSAQGGQLQADMRRVKRAFTAKVQA
jgi:hypothetical protein